MISYFTGEGRYLYLFSHHLKLLAHLRNGYLINITIYLSRSINAISMQFKKYGVNSLIHHGLITLIVEYYLKITYPGAAWEEFLREGAKIQNKKKVKNKVG